MSQKIAAAMPVRAADKQAPAQYIRYGLAFQHHFENHRKSAGKVNILSLLAVMFHYGCFGIECSNGNDSQFEFALRLF